MASQLILYPDQLQDQFGRIKRKLRISITDRCNFKCLYCMPQHPEWLAKKELLSFESLLAFCELMVEQGIESIRITGGEPLMRQGVVHFIQSLHHLRDYGLNGNGLKRISMTSNGHYLAKYAQDLKQAGLDDINISLDSLDEQQFYDLTQKQLAPVLEGIKAAQDVGLSIKINTVLIKGINDNQILPLVAWGKRENLPIRFIEYMPLDGDAQWQQHLVVTEAEILAQLSTHYQVTSHIQQHEPARMYRLDDEYPMGIISTISNSFCGQCDRLRLTAKGEFFSCLFSQNGIALKPLLDDWLRSTSPNDKNSLLQRIQHAVWHKQAGYPYLKPTTVRKISMYALGG
ncbi:MAG: GTP 3',8-cyclase MoaA [Acinetobacter sp.]|nr:MAG: GTP 3',8-cyclase MoaA [Acinetobacter sp.]